VTNRNSYVVAEFEVTRIVEEASNFEDAAPELLRALGESLRWDVGEIWMLEADVGLLRRTAVWHTPNLDLHDFEALSHAAAPRGFCLPGRVLASGNQEWICDIRTDPAFMRGKAAARAGLRTAVGFPLTGGRQVNGAVVLLRREAAEREDGLSAALNAVGHKIGQFALLDRVLRRSPAYFRTIVEKQADIVALIGVDGVIKYENLAVTEVLGYNRRERLGRNVYEFIHPEDVPGALTAFRAALDEPGAPQAVRMRARHKDGSWKQLESMARVIVDASGTHLALVSSRDASWRTANDPSSAGSGGLAMTDREIQILQLMAAGMSNKKIAETVYLSPNTVKDQVRVIFRKLDAGTRVAAVVAATKRGLL